MTDDGKSGSTNVEQLSDLRERCAKLEIALGRAEATEQELRRIVSMQKNILDGIPDLAWLKDREGRFLAVNQAFEQACGIDAQKLIGMTDFDFWPHEVAERFRADDREVMKTGRRKRIEETLVRESAEQTWIETIKSPIRDESRAVMGTTGISRNITKYVQDIIDAAEAKQRIATELAIGGQIQMRMLPEDLERFCEETPLRVSAKCKPAREVGGDLYDCFWADEDAIYVVVGDVAGKGVGAALFMALTMALVRMAARNEPRPHKVLQTVNAELARGNTLCMFVTLFLARVDLTTGVVVHANAGHHPPCPLPANLGCAEVETSPGIPLGLLDTATYVSGKTTLAPGDGLFFFTDGITEAEDTEGAFFSEAKLKDFLRRMPSTDPQTVVSEVFREVETFAQGAPQADDITALCLFWDPSAK